MELYKSMVRMVRLVVSWPWESLQEYIESDNHCVVTGSKITIISCRKTPN